MTLVVLAACTAPGSASSGPPPDPDAPVPSTVDVATDEFVCNGVPAQATRLIIGRYDVEALGRAGRAGWFEEDDGERRAGIICDVRSTRDATSGTDEARDPSIRVTVERLGSPMSTEDAFLEQAVRLEAAYRDTYTMAAGTEPIAMDGAGWGYTSGPGLDQDGDTASQHVVVDAAWYCHGRTLRVAVTDPDEHRDARHDVTALVTSMLPWHCDGAAVPPLQMNLEG